MCSFPKAFAPSASLAADSAMEWIGFVSPSEDVFDGDFAGALGEDLP